MFPAVNLECGPLCQDDCCMKISLIKFLSMTARDPRARILGDGSTVGCKYAGKGHRHENRDDKLIISLYKSNYKLGYFESLPQLLRAKNSTLERTRQVKGKAFGFTYSFFRWMCFPRLECYKNGPEPSCCG